MSLMTNLFSGLMDKLKANQATKAVPLFGTSKEGQAAEGMTPQYLQNAGQAGGNMGNFFAQAFQQLLDPRGLNAQLNTQAQGTAGRARKARSSGKFAGSPIGEVMAQGIETGGAHSAQQTRLADQQNKLQQGMGLSQAFSGAVTNPLMQILGLSTGQTQADEALAQNQKQFMASQPSTFDKLSGLAAGIFCWVARATLQDDRWKAAQQFMLNEATPHLVSLYWHHGEELAARVKADPALRQELLPAFEEFARRGAKYLE